MAYDDDNAIVLWPEYFDKNRTRAEGRRLPKVLTTYWFINKVLCYP